jgi:dTDP-glucose pyrophosphorylase
MSTGLSNHSHPGKKLRGLIPAAGKGVRARPYTHEVHKGMLTINGVPNIERIIAIMRNELQISEIVIVTGHLGETIRDYFGSGEKFGVSINYIENHELDRGWSWSVFLAREYIDSYFCIMLCDESYIGSNHAELLNEPYSDYFALCAGMHVDDAELIHKNYALEHNNKLLSALIEKPTVITNDLMGSGTFICSPDIFPVLEQAFKNSHSLDFVNFLNTQLQHGRPMLFFELKGTYVNINDRDSLHLARYHDRINHFADYSASLLICSEVDEDRVAFTVNRYRELNFFQQIAVLIPHNSDIPTRLSRLNIEWIVCPKHIVKFGERAHYGLSRLSGDILVMTEADYSFPSRDVEKLLSYLKEADLVIGTRTTRQLIEQGSTMRGIVRAAHTSLGGLLEILWWTKEGRFTDVGCTFRALWKSTYQQIDDDLTTPGPEFLAEMVIATLNQRLRVLEIPVNYFNRTRSQHRYRNAATFFRLLAFIIKKRLTPAKTPKRLP